MFTPTSTLTPIETIDRSAADRGGAVSLREVSKSYGDSTVVRDLSLDFAAGEFFTLARPVRLRQDHPLRMIGGFVDPTQARYCSTARGHHLPPNRRDVNTVFQSYALFPHLSVWRERRFRARRRKVGEGRDRRVASARCSNSSSSPARDERQAARPLRRPAAARGARARTGHRPAVLLLDEPLAALDLKLRKAMQMELEADSARGRHHLRVRHARPGGGADHVRPHRGHERRQGAPMRHARGHLRTTRHALRRGVHRHRQPDDRHVRRHRDHAGRGRAGCIPVPSPAVPSATKSPSLCARKRCGSPTSNRTWCRPTASSGPPCMEEPRRRTCSRSLRALRFRCWNRTYTRRGAEKRWVDGERVRIGWRAEHSLAPLT